MRNVFIFLIANALMCSSCQPNDDFEVNNSSLIVEGWIENDGFPVVILTQSIPVTQTDIHPDSLCDYLVRWAKVTVSDGTDSVTLTGKYDSGYFPPYVYTTSRLKGETGKNYSLTVDYKDFHATAITTIPMAPSNVAFSVKHCTGSDTLYQIMAHFKDNPYEKNYYQFFARVGTNTKQYLASYLGAIDDAILGESSDAPIYRGHQLKSHDYTPYFYLDDSVSVKFAQIDEMAYRFWDDYSKVLSLSGNMFLSSYANIRSNIHGGFGYWCGYGAITRHIVIRDSVP